MGTPAQNIANCENAKKSTGPKTPEGKKIASANATTHGLLSTRILLPDEDPDEFADFYTGLEADLAPATAEERLHFDRWVGLNWKLRRGDHIERQLFIKGASAGSNCGAGILPACGGGGNDTKCLPPHSGSDCGAGILPACSGGILPPHSAPQRGDSAEDSTPAIRRQDAAGTSRLQAGATTETATPSATSLADAICAHPREFALITRYMTGHSRDAQRARADLRKLQTDRAAATPQQAEFTPEECEKMDQLLTRVDLNRKIDAIDWHAVRKQLQAAAMSEPQGPHPLPETCFAALAIWFKHGLVVSTNSMDLESASRIAANQVALDMLSHNVLPEPGKVWGAPDALAEYRAKSAQDGLYEGYREIIRRSQLPGARPIKEIAEHYAHYELKQRKDPATYATAAAPG